MSDTPEASIEPTAVAVGKAPTSDDNVSFEQFASIEPTAVAVGKSHVSVW